ncbi:hypothetical protein LZF95_20895 [Algoriphagus sp. AGSA1]|uniref:thermonuclease family protein n=1 Tax=Algoriphagus sp. AGSA1 TaxID=2907213 RepID=UPI001F3A92CE|nr:hypothetical protein [Algoriphagus sp. AGSA1]MCE7057151.1 hypothetical protein [Algoriphagus sp. AGSA1]
MRKFLLTLIFLFTTFALLFAQERHGPYKIHKFVDGDTFWVKMGAGKNEKIRLIGMDTPEVKWEGLTDEQRGGKEDSRYMKKLEAKWSRLESIEE